LSQIALGEMPAGEMRQGPPSRLAEAKRAEALIELVTPDASGFLDKLSDSFRIDGTHR
jgi:hypothetical protein